MSAVLIERIMSKTVAQIVPECLLFDVVQVMLRKRISCMIVAYNDKPLGLISERDVVRILRDAFAGDMPSSLTAADAMSSPAITVKTTATVHETLCLIEERDIRHLAVVDEKGNLVGVLTQSDLLRGQSWELEIERQSQWALSRQNGDYS
jgi:CBS domain-containing protein